MENIHIKVFGRVQGVFFRVETKKIADRLGIMGSVSNLSDGRVEIFANGSEKNLKELLKWCYNGPTGAEVENVEFDWNKNEKTFDKFEIV